MTKCMDCGYSLNNCLMTLKFNGNILSYCPNCMARKIAYNELTSVLRNDPSLIDDITNTAGAIEFSCYGERYYLKKQTMLRLLAYNLKPSEYKKLSKKYGPYGFMIHDDFYTKDGISIQPIEN